MDYLDELDEIAMQALVELDAASDVQQFPIASHLGAIVSNDATSQHRVSRRRRVQAAYLLCLEHPLSSPRCVAQHLALPRVPQRETGVGEASKAEFCYLDQSAVDALDSWTSKHFPSKKWTKIRVGVAYKDQAPPTLGQDVTLPQYRPSRSDSLAMDSSRDYPLQYFFYGTLACTERLARLFDVPVSSLAVLQPAVLLDGRIRTWANKYRALIDYPGERVEGHAFSVSSREEEDALRRYEGDSYEVVTARMIVNGNELECYSFRFAGYEDELNG